MTDQDLREKSKEAVDRIREKSEDDFEKQLIFIASGALGISFAFLEKLVNLSKSIHLWVLALAWICLSLALCVNLASHYISKNLAQKSSDDQDLYFDGKIDYDLLCLNIKQRNKNIDIVNYLSVVALFLGLALLIAFITVNISHMSEDKPRTKPLQVSIEERGRSIPTPRPQTEPVQQKPQTAPAPTESTRQTTEK